MDFTFKSNFIFTVKLDGQQRGFPYASCTHTCIASSIINIPHQSSAFVMINKSTMTHQNQPTSTVCQKVCFWCCIFYRFGQMYNTRVLHSSTILNVFIALKILCAPSVNPPPPAPWQSLVFLLSLLFYPSQNVV